MGLSAEIKYGYMGVYIWRWIKLKALTVTARVWGHKNTTPPGQFQNLTGKS